jgi:hypothetical protein
VRSYTEATIDYAELVDTLLTAKFRWFLCGYVHPALQRLGNPSWAMPLDLEEPIGMGKRLAGATERHGLEMREGHSIQYSEFGLQPENLRQLIGR